MRFEKTCRTPQRGVRTLARRCSPVYDSAIYLLKRGPCPQRLREAFLNTSQASDEIFILSKWREKRFVYSYRFVLRSIL